MTVLPRQTRREILSRFYRTPNPIPSPDFQYALPRKFREIIVLRKGDARYRERDTFLRLPDDR